MNKESSFWNTPETDDALANAECESDLVLSMRSMESQRNKYKAALVKISEASGFDNINGWARNIAKEALK